jgi:hypothetical protein
MLSRGAGKGFAIMRVRSQAGWTVAARFRGERKVRAPQGAVVGNSHRPRCSLRECRRIGKVQQKVNRLEWWLVEGVW